jgi:hypothetical protein
VDNEIAQDILLENLSFYEWMNIENILISIDPKDLVLIEDLSLDELKAVLKTLCKSGHVEEKELDGEAQFRRIHKKTLKSKVLKLFT